MASGVTLHVEFGPVVEFIAEARRTRDTWAGSYILSYLMANALHAAVGSDTDKLTQPNVRGNALFEAVAARREGEALPDLGLARRVGSLPDRFEMVVADAEEAAKIATAAIDAWQGAWLDLADAVWKYLEGRHWPANEETGRLWNEQVGTRTQPAYWRARWTVGSYGDHMRGWNVHPFEGLAAQDGEKSTLGGERTALHGGQMKRAQVRTFWGMVAGTVERYEIAEDGTERLDAVNMVKRLFPLVSKETIGWEVETSYPSTRTVAVVPWLVNLLTCDDDEVMLRIEATPSALAAAKIPRLQHFKPNPYLIELAGGHVFAEQAEHLLHYEGGVFFPESPEAWEETGLRSNATLVADARKALRDLRKCAGSVGVDPPSSFFAILSMDGDSLGHVLSELPEIQGALSAALGEFSREVPGIIEGEGRLGHAVYAGGDDVLAFLPMETALKAAELVARAYRSKVMTLIQEQEQKQVEEARARGEEPPPAEKHKAKRGTISAGIVYANVSTPLGVLIRRSQTLLHTVAKRQEGKDSFAVEVWKAGGPILQVARPWGWSGEGAISEQVSATVGEIEWAKEQLRIGGRGGGFSNRLFYRLQPVIEMLNSAESQLSEEQRANVLLAEHLTNRDLPEGLDPTTERERVLQLTRLLTRPRKDPKGEMEWQVGRFVRFLTEREA